MLQREMVARAERSILCKESGRKKMNVREKVESWPA
jgi:hypothetical protein